MGIFSTSTPYDETLDKLTNETNTEIDWGLVITLCDKVKQSPKGPHEFSGAILSRINNKVPHVSMQAITVLDSCINNCGKEFHQEVASQGFTDSLRDIVYHYKNKTVTKRLRYFIRKWAEEFKEDSELSHFVSFYYFLRGEGLEFPDTDDNPTSGGGAPKKKEQVSSDPNVVSSQQEADDIAKAIEESLREEKQRKSYTTTTSSEVATSSLYPSMLGGSTNTPSSYSTASYSPSNSAAKRKVKALYDFEAAEDNELTFKAGDIISIIDESDVNWWKGEGSNGSGLFPANFVTSDLSVEPEPEVGGVRAEEEERETSVKFSDELEVKEVYQSEPVLAVNEETIDRALTVLQNTDPESTVTDGPELIRDEESCVQMGKLIDRKLEDIDRNHLELSMLNEKILESLKMYDTLMKEMPAFPAQQYMPATGNMQMHPQTMPGYNPNQYYNPGFMPPNTTQEASLAPGPSGGIPNSVGSNQVNPAQNMYNPMYQQQQQYMSNATMQQTNMNSTNVNDPSQQSINPQNNYSNAYQTPATTNSPKFHGSEPTMAQYQQNNSNLNGYAQNHQNPMHFSTNQAPAQPHM